jgi:hypothetical protein
LIEKREAGVRNGLRLVCIGAAASVIVVGCTMKNASVPPAQLMSQFQTGQAVLDCRADCSFAWDQNRAQAAALDATGRWQELAVLVMQVGFMNDLSYYYLGHAAENLGYLQPAEKYYRIAERLSVTDMSCHQMQVNNENMTGALAGALGLNAQPVGDVCDGYVFPDALYPHLEVVESRLAALSAPSEPIPRRQAKRRVARKPAPRTPTAATSLGAGQASGSGFVVPTPAAGTPASGSGFVEPAPTTSGSTPAASDQFAIPPVRH